MWPPGPLNTNVRRPIVLRVGHDRKEGDLGVGRGAHHHQVDGAVGSLAQLGGPFEDPPRR
jgi:hypothetical protein